MSSSLKGENHLTIWRINVNGPLGISYLHHCPINGVMNDCFSFEMNERYVVDSLRDSEAASRILIRFILTETLLNELSMRLDSARFGYQRISVEHGDTEKNYILKINYKYMVLISQKNEVQIHTLESLNSCEKERPIPVVNSFKVSQLPS